METQLRFADEMDQKADVSCVAFPCPWCLRCLPACASASLPSFFFFFPPNFMVSFSRIKLLVLTESPPWAARSAAPLPPQRVPLLLSGARLTPTAAAR